MRDAAENTDRELYREPDKTGAGDYYSNSLHVTEGRGVGINVGGLVFVKTLAEWHALAVKFEPINWRDDPAAIVEDDGRQDGRDYA
jgi:hypothetical protein